MKTLLGSCSTLLLVACASAATVPEAERPVSEPETRPATANASSPRSGEHGDAVSIGKRIREACGITESEAFFRFDSARVDKRTRDTLSKIAQCFTSGPLSGSSMSLVGHTDPRGEDGYNMALGESRAQSVKEVIQSFGVDGERIGVTSRGEIDAREGDEHSYARDRRVDIEADG